MKHYRLRWQETVASGFTDLFIVTYRDFSSADLGSPESVVLLPLEVGDVVMNLALLEVKTPAHGLTQADGSVGLSSGGSLIGDSSLLSGGGRYYAPANSVAPLPAVAAANLRFTITPFFEEGSGEAVGTINAGEFRIWASISRKKDRLLQV